MANVTLTAALRSNLLSLQGTQKLLDSTQLKLATGLKVNSALDSPSAFFAAQSLTNRAGDLTRRLDGIGQAIQTLKSADEGIKSLTSFLEQAQAIAQEARDQSGAGGGSDITGSLTAANVADITTIAGVANNNTFTLRVGTGPITTFTITTGETLQTLADQLNTVDGVSASIEASTVAGEFQLRLASENGQAITLANGTGTPLTGLALATIAAGGSAPADQATLQSSYDQVRTQINSLVADASYRGTNLLNGDSLTTQFAETAGASTLSITGVTFTAAGLNVAAANFGTSASIDTALNQIQAALTTVRAQARTFGNNLSIIQNRQDFTQNLVNVLKEGSDKLTLADKNEEGANLLSLQTSQQLGISALSLASQSNQAVLRLFS
jgi:flagellin